MQRYGGTLNAYYEGKEGSLKKLHRHGSNYRTIQKRQNNGNDTGQHTRQLQKSGHLHHRKQPFLRSNHQTPYGSINYLIQVRSNKMFQSRIMLYVYLLYLLSLPRSRSSAFPDTFASMSSFFMRLRLWVWDRNVVTACRRSPIGIRPMTDDVYFSHLRKVAAAGILD